MAYESGPHRIGTAYIIGVTDACQTAIEERLRARTQNQGHVPHGFAAHTDSSRRSERVLGVPGALFEVLHAI